MDLRSDCNRWNWFVSWVPENVVEKFREVSGTVWICLKGML